MDVPPDDAAKRPVLILGAGVNGLCVARELAINGVPVVVVDRGDIGGGTSAKSSRLIHGGLRYLEYGEFHLVRESLDERTRLLKLAPHLVRPLQLHIPVRRRSGGLIRAAVRFMGGSRIGWLQSWLDRLHVSTERGLWAARIGLTLYDWIARRGKLPRHTARRTDDGQGPTLNPQYRWVCSYWDAQMAAPERFCIALAQDALEAARAAGSSCQVLTYHNARLTDWGVAISPTLRGMSDPEWTLRPAMIVNATGAWGDLTLRQLTSDAPRLFGGTRGSHIITRQTRLRHAVGEEAIYAEAPDGRLVFIIPWWGTVLIGTTDERFDAAPESAVATEDEIAYLIGMVNRVLPSVALQRADVESHYCGVRPLPFVPVGRTAAISRDHAIDTRFAAGGLRIDTIVGGKLTTCRALGELVADGVLQHLRLERRAHTRERLLPGNANYPATPANLATAVAALEQEYGLTSSVAQTVWSLFGTRSAQVLREAAAGAAGVPARPLLPGTAVPISVVDWIIRHEQVRTVADLVERRLLLVFASQITRHTLEVLEARLRSVHGGCLPEGTAAAAAESLAHHYGRRLTDDTPEPQTD